MIKSALCLTADPVGTVGLPGITFPSRPSSVAGCGELNVYRAMALQVFGVDPGTAGSLTL
jgi:hypothetical protein